MALAFLVTERHRPVDRHELAEVLWGDQLPATWESALRTHLTKLRGLLRSGGLPEDVLVARRGCYQLRLPDDVVVDVEAAAADLHAAQEALAAGDPDSARRLASVAAMVAGRQFLPGADGVWVERRQAEIRHLRVEALEVLAHAATGVGDWATAVGAAEEVVALEPLRESAYVQLMAAHAAAGRRGEALRVYGRCRAVLADELRVNPSQATETAYQTLLDAGHGDALSGELAASSLATAAWVDDADVAGEHSGRPDVGLPARLAGEEVFAFVSRTAERQLLDEVWAGVVTRTPRLVLVGGEPGSGKTRLVAELARDAHRRGAAVLWGACADGLAVPVQPFTQALRQVLDHVDSAELAAVLGPHAGELVRLVPDLRQRLAGLPEPVRSDPETDRFRLFEAVAGWLAALGGHRPVLLVVDDMQWATAPTVMLVRHLLQVGRPGRLLAMIGTYRDTEIDRHHPLGALLGDVGRLPGLSRVNLGGLDTAGIGSLAAEIGDQPLDQDGRALVELVHRDTAGNPLYAGELLRHLNESGRLRRDDGGWASYRSVAEMGVPEGVSQVVRRRVDRLTDVARSALNTASVLGADFELDLLAAITGIGEDRLIDALEEALQAKLLTEHQDRPGCFAFSHAIVQAALADDLTKTRRSRLHLRIGAAIEALYRDNLVDHLPALAHHHIAAAPLGDPIEAGTYALRAGCQAADQLAFEQACELFRLGLSTIEKAGDPAARLQCELLIALADASQGTVETKSAAKRAADLARRLDQPVYLAQAASAYCDQAMAGVPDQVAVAMCEDALAALEPDQHALRSMVLASLAIYRALNEDVGESADDIAQAAVQSARSAQATAAPPDRDGRMILSDLRRPVLAVLAHALVNRAGVLVFSTRFDDRLSINTELQALTQMSGMSESFATLIYRMPLLLELGDAGGFRSEVRNLSRGSANPQLPAVQALLSVWEGMLATIEGRFEEVEPHLGRVLHNGQRSQDANFLLAYAAQLFTLRREQGQVADVLDQVRDLLAQNPGLVIVRLMLALFLIDLGERNEATELLGALAVDGFSGVPRGATWTSSLAYLSEIAAEVADQERADGLYRLFLPHAGHLAVSSWGSACFGAADRFLGMLASTSARWDRAEAHFETAMTIEADAGAPALLARTQYWFARTLLGRDDDGDRERAAQLLTDARFTASTLGMKILEAQAGQLFAV